MASPFGEYMINRFVFDVNSFQIAFVSHSRIYEAFDGSEVTSTEEHCEAIAETSFRWAESGAALSALVVVLVLNPPDFCQSFEFEI